jgi:hypothetical protein
MIQTIFGSPVVLLKADNIEEIFPKELYENSLNQLLRPSIKRLKHPFARGGELITTDHNVDPVHNEIIDLNLLFNFLKKISLNYAHLFSTKPVKNLKFHASWTNLMFKGSEIQNHCDSYDTTEYQSLIITFYPKVPLGSANLVFINDSKSGDWASECNEKDIVRIAVEEGSIVIFDNRVLHAVDVHSLDAPRMCIATEYIIET